VSLSTIVAGSMRSRRENGGYRSDSGQPSVERTTRSPARSPRRVRLDPTRFAKGRGDRAARSDGRAAGGRCGPCSPARSSTAAVATGRTVRVARSRINTVSRGAPAGKLRSWRAGREWRAEMPAELQELLGYSIHPPFIGQLTASHPVKALGPDYENRVVAQGRARQERGCPSRRRVRRVDRRAGRFRSLPAPSPPRPRDTGGVSRSFAAGRRSAAPEERLAALAGCPTGGSPYAWTNCRGPATRKALRVLRDKDSWRTRLLARTIPRFFFEGSRFLFGSCRMRFIGKEHEDQFPSPRRSHLLRRLPPGDVVPPVPFQRP
jgi:hypothetical protein